MEQDQQPNQQPSFKSNFPPLPPGGEETQSPFPLAAFIIVILLIAAVVGGVLLIKNVLAPSVPATDNLAVGENTATPTDAANAGQADQTASLINTLDRQSAAPAEIGAGEVIFTGSAKQNAIVRQINLFNPFKQNWVLVYDGYKEISSAPMEIFRARLAAITYTKAQLVTVGGAIDINKELTVKKDGTVTFPIEW